MKPAPPIIRSIPQPAHPPVVRPEFQAEAQRIRDLRASHAEWIKFTRRAG